MLLLLYYVIFDFFLFISILFPIGAFSPYMTVRSKCPLAVKRPADQGIRPARVEDWKKQKKTKKKISFFIIIIF